MDNLKKLRIAYYKAKAIEEAVYAACRANAELYDAACEAYEIACAAYNSDTATYEAYNKACEAWEIAEETYEAYEDAERWAEGNTYEAADEHDTALDAAIEAELDRQGNFND
jgi:hypothetical protein